MRRYESARLQAASAIIERRHPQAVSAASLAFEASTLEAAAAILQRQTGAAGWFTRLIFRFVIHTLLQQAADLQEYLFKIMN